MGWKSKIQRRCTSCGEKIDFEQFSKFSGLCPSCTRELKFSSSKPSISKNHGFQDELNEELCFYCNRASSNTCHKCGKPICNSHTFDRVWTYNVVRKMCSDCNDKFGTITIVLKVIFPIIAIVIVVILGIAI